MWLAQLLLFSLHQLLGSQYFVIYGNHQSPHQL